MTVMWATCTGITGTNVPGDQELSSIQLTNDRAYGRCQTRNKVEQLCRSTLLRDKVACLTSPIGFFMKLRQGCHVERVTSYRKSISVHRCVKSHQISFPSALKRRQSLGFSKEPNKNNYNNNKINRYGISSWCKKK